MSIYSCVADNSLGRAKKYIEVSGRPGPAEFHSSLYSRSKDSYNLTWSIESIPPLEEIRLLYRKLNVCFFSLIKIDFIKKKIKPILNGNCFVDQIIDEWDLPTSGTMARHHFNTEFTRYWQLVPTHNDLHNQGFGK